MMNPPFSPNLVRPNLPLRKPSSSLPPNLSPLSPLAQATLLGASPVRPASPMASPSTGHGAIQSPASTMHPTPNRDKIAVSSLATPSLTVHFCNFCGQQGNLRCKRCKKTAYCSVVCQTEDWKAHRHMCKATDAEPVKEKMVDNSISLGLGDMPVNLTNTDTANIQRVFMKDLSQKVVTGTEIQAAVVEFSSPGRFFVVAQSPELLEALQTITTELQKTYSFSSTAAHIPVVDEVCAAQYSCDMNWYRGLVQAVAPDQNTAHILYIDFGNEEKVPFERIKPLSAKLQQYGPCAMECSIAGVVPMAGMWSGKCCIAVRQVLEGKTVIVQVLNTLENVHSVDIVLSNGNTLSSFLLKHEYAEKETIKETTQEDMNAMMNASLENFKRLSNGKDDNLWAQGPEPLTQAVGDSFSVVVTHFQSPDKIVVQKVDNAAVIQDLQSKLREHCLQVPVSSNFRPAPGTVCCALFSEDKQWYRAKVLAYLSEERICVGYLDFGNSEDVDLNSLRPTTQSLLAIPMQAMTCVLAGVQPHGESWTEDCLVALQRRISNRILRIEIQGAQDGKALVAIIDEASDPQANISELLISAGFAAPAVVNTNRDPPTEKSAPVAEIQVEPSLEPEPLVWSCVELSQEGPPVALRVCSVETPATFFCHIDNHTDIQRLIELQAELKAYCEAATSPFDPKLGGPCCAVFPGNQMWYRAMVNEFHEDEVLVTFVDYGHCMRVKKSHLRPILPRFLTLPFMALPCWLAGVEPRGSDWSREALLWFQTLVENDQILGRVLSVNEQGYGVELETRGTSVATALVSQQLAKFTGDAVKDKQETTSNDKQNKNAAEKRQEEAPNKLEPERGPSDEAPSLLEVPSFPVDWKTVVLPVNETFQPCIAAVCSPSLFYLFGPRQVGEEKHQEMMLLLAEYCNTQASQSAITAPSKPVSGSACCARFTADNNWYRAVVLEVCDQEASIIYADYGNSEKVSLSHILPIPSRFLQLPFQVTRCSLLGKELFPAEWPADVQAIFLSVVQQGVLATVQSFDGTVNLLSLSLPTERGGGQVEVTILDALQAHSKTSTEQVTDPPPPSTDTKVDSPEPIPPEISPEDEPSNREVLTPEPTTALPQMSKNTEAAHDDPVQKIIKQMEPPCTTDSKTRDALASSCCCQSLRNKIDQLEQLMQVQLSLIKKLVAQVK